MTPSSQDSLVVQYESLRADAVTRGMNGSPGLGRRILLHQGMSSWMEAWAKMRQLSARAPLPTPTPTPVREDTSPVAPADDMVALLVEMALQKFTAVLS